MNSCNISNNKKEELKQMKPKDKIENLKSNYILKKIFGNLKIKKILNINIDNYKEFCEKYSSIEIEIIACKSKKSKYIKIEGDKEKYYHIYFNDSKEEIKKNELSKDDNVSRIKIIIDYQIKSFERLFQYCDCIESIIFKKFYRINIKN